jgi:hypothetical protein
MRSPSGRAVEGKRHSPWHSANEEGRTPQRNEAEIALFAGSATGSPHRIDFRFEP